MARKRQDLARLLAEPGREVVTLAARPAFQVLAYADEEFVQVGELVMPRRFWFVWIPWRVEARSPAEPENPALAALKSSASSYGQHDTILQLRVAQGGLEVDAVTLLRRTDDPPLSSTSLREVNLRSLVVAAGMRAGGRITKGKLRPAVLGPDVSDDKFWLETIERDRAALTSMQKPRRGKPLTDELLEWVTTLYRQALAQGRRNPTQHVADTIPVSYSTAANYVMRSRRRGAETGNTQRFLGPTSFGRAGEITRRRKKG